MYECIINTSVVILPSKMYFCHKVSKSVNIHQQLTNDWPYSPFILTDILNTHQ